MLTGLLHRVVAQPRAYDLVQTLVGVSKVRRRLARTVAPLRSAAWVLDIGGGTGAVGELWGESTRYICLDIDPLKLRGFAAKNPTGTALLADATAIPLADGSVDVVLCTHVTHHLTESQLDQAIAESARVLRAGGKLVLSDAVWAPSRRIGRLLWRYDRGDFPRTPEVLRAAISRHFKIGSWEQFAVWHEYFIAVAEVAGSF